MFVAAGAHQHVVWLDVPVQEASRMQVLNSFDHLVADGEDGFERKGFSLRHKDVFKTLAQEVHHHEIEAVFNAGCINPRDSNDGPIAVQIFVQLRLKKQLRMLCGDGLGLNCVTLLLI